jgi:hypothetical protein
MEPAQGEANPGGEIEFHLYPDLQNENELRQIKRKL